MLGRWEPRLDSEGVADPVRLGVEVRRLMRRSWYCERRGPKSRRVKLLGLLRTSSLNRSPSDLEPVHFCICRQPGSSLHKDVSILPYPVLLQYLAECRTLSSNKSLQQSYILATSNLVNINVPAFLPGGFLPFNSKIVSPKFISLFLGNWLALVGAVRASG